MNACEAEQAAFDPKSEEHPASDLRFGVLSGKQFLGDPAVGLTMVSVLWLSAESAVLCQHPWLGATLSNFIPSLAQRWF